MGETDPEASALSVCGLSHITQGERLNNEEKGAGVLALCKRLAQEASRRASAAESWATLVFGRLNRHQCALKFARELAELAEKDAAELRQLISLLVYQLKS